VADENVAGEKIKALMAVMGKLDEIIPAHHTKKSARIGMI
jgi:hypothetical protein